MRPFVASLCAALAAAPAHARITRLDILETTPFASGAPFGDAGPYVRIRAIAHGELDPAAPANAGIALIDKAPRNPRGMVEYDTDVEIMRPADPARSSHVMLFDVPNRGNKYVPSWLNDAREPQGGMLNDPRTLEDAGNGFVFRRGYTVVWAGWQPEAPAANNGMRIRVPVATNGGLPIVQRIRNEFLAGTRGPEGAYRFPLPYPAADMQGAQMTMRAREEDPRIPVPVDGWRWMDANRIQTEPYASPVRNRWIYELTYEATAPTVNGIGFAAIRDVASHMRKQDGTRHALGFGRLPQRPLPPPLPRPRHEQGRGRRPRLRRPAPPHRRRRARSSPTSPSPSPAAPPHSHEDRFYPEVWQPVGYGGPNSLLRDPATDPKIIETNTSTEYWQKGASLVHDAPLPPTVRMLMIAGTQHGGHFGTAATPGACANPRNPNSSGPALRAALANLEAWVVRGTPPPETLVPRQADETAIPAAAIRMPRHPRRRLGPPRQPHRQARRLGSTRPPPPSIPCPPPSPPWTPTATEVAGLRLPHVAVPLGTYTGVNVYKGPPRRTLRPRRHLPPLRPHPRRTATAPATPGPSLEERYKGRARLPRPGHRRRRHPGRRPLPPPRGPRPHRQHRPRRPGLVNRSSRRLRRDLRQHAEQRIEVGLLDQQVVDPERAPRQLDQRNGCRIDFVPQQRACLGEQSVHLDPPRHGGRGAKPRLQDEVPRLSPPMRHRSAGRPDPKLDEMQTAPVVSGSCTPGNSDRPTVSTSSIRLVQSTASLTRSPSRSRRSKVACCSDQTRMSAS